MVEGLYISRVSDFEKEKYRSLMTFAVVRFVSL